MPTIDEQVALLMQGVEYGDPTTKETMTQELRERLIEAEKNGRPLRVYCGYDPRTTDLHLGHTITMRKLAQFQDLGHDVTFLVGTFTSLIGDPSDKDTAREQLTAEVVRQNAETYAEQAFKILDRDRDARPPQRRMAVRPEFRGHHQAGEQLHRAAVPGAG